MLHDPKAVKALVASASQQPEYQDATRIAVLGLRAGRYGDLDQAFACCRRSIIDLRGRAAGGR